VREKVHHSARTPHQSIRTWSPRRLGDSNGRTGYIERVDLRVFSALRDLAREEDSPVVISGDCMEPLLRRGETVRVRARRVYLPGDVVVFRTRAGDLAAHRVLGWHPRGLVTKGDDCVERDAPVSRDDIVGAARLHIAFADRLRAFAAWTRIAARRIAR